MEGLHVINEPKLVYNQQGKRERERDVHVHICILISLGGKIKTGCYCMGNQSVVAASTNGSIHAFRLINFN